MFVTHLTGFNADLTFPAGSHGSGGERERESYLKNVPAPLERQERGGQLKEREGRELESEEQMALSECPVLCV